MVRDFTVKTAHDDEACDPAARTPPSRPEQLDSEGLAQNGRPHARAPSRAKPRKVRKFGFSQQRHTLVQPSLRTLALPLLALALEVAPLVLRERRLFGSSGGSRVGDAAGNFLSIHANCWTKQWLTGRDTTKSFLFDPRVKPVRPSNMLDHTGKSSLDS